jgi:hypothetical protein
VYALSVVLLSFLVFSGLGSIASERWFRSGGWTLPRFSFPPRATLLAENVLLPRVFHSSAIGWPVELRVLLSIARILPPRLDGALLRAGHPQARGVAPELIPWPGARTAPRACSARSSRLVLAIHQGFTAVAAIRSRDTTSCSARPRVARWRAGRARRRRMARMFGWLGKRRDEERTIPGGTEVEFLGPQEGRAGSARLVRALEKEVRRSSRRPRRAYLARRALRGARARRGRAGAWSATATRRSSDPAQRIFWALFPLGQRLDLFFVTDDEERRLAAVCRPFYAAADG